MIQQFRHRQFSASNPLANALVIIVGVVVIAVSLVLGVVAFVALLAAAIVMAAVIWIRVWWLNRKLGAGRKTHANQAHKSGVGAEIIEGEFRVVGHERERESGG
jgi:hypothetical protein